MSESKSWLELESDPGLFTLLVDDFGVSGVQVEEIYDLSKSLDQTIYGFIFLFKWVERRTRRRAPIETINYVTDVNIVNNMFFARQVIPNSCATNALLSILLNSANVNLGSFLKKFQLECNKMTPEEKGLAIGNNEQLFKSHNSYARPDLINKKFDKTLTASSTTTATASSSNSEVFHYICFVPVNDHLYELDGLKPYPIDHGLINKNENWTEKLKKIIIDRINLSSSTSSTITSTTATSLFSSSFTTTHNYYLTSSINNNHQINDTNNSQHSKVPHTNDSLNNNNNSHSNHYNNSSSNDNNNGYYVNNMIMQQNHDIRFNLMALVPDKLNQFKENINIMNKNRSKLLNFIENLIKTSETSENNDDTLKSTSTTNDTITSTNTRQLRSRTSVTQLTNVNSQATTTTTQASSSSSSTLSPYLLNLSIKIKSMSSDVYLFSSYLNYNNQNNVQNDVKNDIFSDFFLNEIEIIKYDVSSGNADDKTLFKFKDLYEIEKKLDVYIQYYENKCKEEIEKRNKYKIDAMRRKHRYDEFIVTYIRMLAENGKLTKLIQTQLDALKKKKHKPAINNNSNHSTNNNLNSQIRKKFKKK